MNKLKLKSVMTLHGDTNVSLSSFLGVSPQRFSAKLNGTNGAEFTKHEMSKIKGRYNLSDDEFMSIFFADVVS